MAFDEDAADGFRPPPHPDDRLWRHPSELKNVGEAGARRHLPEGDDLPTPGPARGPDWLGIAGHMALVGGVGVVAIALALAVLGIPQRVRDRPQETTLSSAASMTTVAPPSSTPSLWNDTDPATDPGDPRTDPADEVAVSGSDVPADGPPATPTAPAEAERSETEPPSAWLGVDGRAAPTVDLDLDMDGDDDGNGPAEGPEQRSYGDDLPDLFPVDLDGVLVTNVVTDSPAASHLWPGDVIVSVDGQPTPDMDTLLEILADRAPGDEVDVVHRRRWHRTPLTATITLAERP